MGETVTSAPDDATGGPAAGHAPAGRAALFAGLAAVLVFLPALGGEIVYDDHRFYAANDGLTDVSVLWRAFLDPAVQTADASYAGLWRPLRTLSFALDRAIWGDGTFGPHLTNVLLHGVATVLLVRLLARLGAGRIAALVGAAVFALHPVQAECVAWVSSRGDLLALVGVLAALLLALPRPEGGASGRPVAAALCGLAALLAKEQAVVWPLLAVLTFRAAGRRWTGALRAAAVPAACTLLFVVVRHLLLADPLQEGGLGAGPVRDTRLLAMLGHQFLTLVLPAERLFDWQMPSPVGPAVLAGLLPLAGLLVRPLRVPVLWFLAALVPTLFVQTVIPLNILVADRFLLFALPALALAVSRLVALDVRTALPAGVIAGCLLVQLQVAVPGWSSERALWTPVAERVHDHPRANGWLGLVELREGQVDAAVDRLSRAVDGSPGTALHRVHLAEALELRFRSTESATDLVAARDHYGIAVRLFDEPRQEGRASLAPAARLAWIDLTLGTGERDAAAALLEDLLSRPPPDVPEAARPAWRARLEQLTGHAARFLDPAREESRRFAPRLRDWGGAP